MTYIYIALGWILDLFYRLVGNYGIAIILFTVFVKLVLLPLDLKQRKSMAKTQKIQPLLMEVQKKYANDKEKLSQETMKLYQKYGINPMGGCLPMLIQFPIIIALWWVVRKPIIYMMGVSESEVWRIAEAFNEWGKLNMHLVPEGISLPLTYMSGSNNSFGIHEIQIAQTIFKHPEILNHEYITSWAEGAALKTKLIDFSFLGMDLSAIPNFSAFLGAFTGAVAITPSRIMLWLIPILSGVSSFCSSRLTMGKQGRQEKKDKNIILSEEEKKSASGNNTGDTMKTMSLIMPLFSAWFAFTLPAAVGLYWIVSNIIQMIQQVCVTKFLVKDISLEEIEGEIANVRKGRKNRKKS